MYDTEPYGIDDPYSTTSELNEIIWLEKLDADREQAQFEAEGDEFYRLELMATKLLDAGRIKEAVRVCPHGGGYGLDGSAAKDENDPRYGEEGMRCGHCGAVVTGCHGDVIHVR